jgi:hypothetical protein
VEETYSELQFHLLPGLPACLFHLSILKFPFRKTVIVYSALHLERIILALRVVWGIFCLPHIVLVCV